MPDREGRENARVLPIIRAVRSRWRLRILLRGLSITLGAGFLAFLLSAYALDAARFSPGAVTGLRLVTWIVVGVVVVVFLLMPLFRRVTDQQVALYLEEHEPTLQASILGAVDVERSLLDGSGGAPALLERLVERAVENARTVEFGRRIDRRGLYQGSGALAAVLFGALAFIVLGPNQLRHGLTALAVPTTGAATVSPYSIQVHPGDATVARGADQLITAELRGFDSDEVHVHSRAGGEGPFQRFSMVPADSGRFDALFVHLLETTEYFVEAGGVRSSTHTIEVAELPYVESMRHVYHFPAYTGLAPREVEGGGTIAALAGTRVEVTVRSTLSSSAGRLMVDDSTVLDLVPEADGTFSGDLMILREGAYRVDLARADGRMVAASPDYAIDVLTDLPPSVAISVPGRDASASAIEEVFVEARADDDYGIRDLRLVLSVNGEPEDTVTLFGARGTPLREVSAGHTVFLEEWDLEAGDVVSYFAVARDNRGGASEEAFSDIYFIQIRPFRRDFRQAEQRPQGGGQPPDGAQGGQRGRGGGLSELQRDVVAATFNLLRDARDYAPEDLSEHVVSVALAQGRVRDEVSTLLVQMHTRGVAGSDPRFQEIAGLLPLAIQEMEAAEALLREEELRDALSPEQRALTLLQKAEETYERYVGEQRQQGAGGGGGGGASADELADLFELELDKLQNQYETVQRGERQQADEMVDELMGRLKELARRQQQEMERQRSRMEQGGAGGTGGDAQRALAEEAEETARQLEELSRRTGDRQLAETARRLQEAAESMRRSAAGSGRSQGLADATSALEELEEAQRRLTRTREDRMEEGIRDALGRVDRLAERQEEVREEVERLPEDLSERRGEVERLHQRKDEMFRETEALERDLVRMSQVARGGERETAQELEEALEALRESRLKEKFAYTKGVVEQREREFALEWEEQIARDIEALRGEVASALLVYGEGRPSRSMEEALERARDLARGAESLARRLESRSAGEGADRAGGDPGARAGSDPARGASNPDSPADGAAARDSFRPFTDEEIRQYARESAQRLAQARELRGILEEEGRSVDDLEEAMGAMARLQDPGTYGDPPQIPLLQEQVRESLRRLEFVLRREVEGERAGRAALTGTDDVPAGFRRMVDEYFRNLARRGGTGQGGG
jgi:hypothetical protein